MPRLPINYNNCVIYKLVCNDLNVKEIYVGHTTCFKERKSKHKCSCNNETGKDYNHKVYQFIRQNGGFENWSMIEIEKHPCCDKCEALKRERYWLENLTATLNSCIPSRTPKEYQKTNFEHLKEKSKEYYENNIERIREHKHEYYENNIEKVKEYLLNNADKIKKQRREHYLNNADKLRERTRQYRLNNADKIREQKRQYRLKIANKID